MLFPYENICVFYGYVTHWLPISSFCLKVAVMLFEGISHVSAHLHFSLRGILLQELQAEAGDFLLDAHHNIGVVLISLKLVGQACHAVSHKFILSCKIFLYCLQGNKKIYETNV